MLARKIIKYLEKLAPPNLALEGDPTGLQIGGLNKEVKNILIALDFNVDVLEEARAKGANLIITHHPLIFKPLKKLEPDSYLGGLIYKAVKNDLTVYSFHTNLDVAEKGVNQGLADLLGLKNQYVLKPIFTQKLYKIVVFIPEGYEIKVREAVAEAGAGWIGEYSHCTFNLKGTGTFKPLEGANPFTGERGKIEEVKEIRLETIITEEIRDKVINSILRAHPYEEVAYDLYPLKNKGKVWGLGRAGKLPQEKRLREVIDDVKRVLQVEALKVTGDVNRKIKKVAVCGGSGGSLIEKAASEGADLFITGDIKYHQAHEALALNLAVIDAGHDATERIIVPYVAEYLEKMLENKGFKYDVLISEVKTNPWMIF